MVYLLYCSFINYKTIHMSISIENYIQSDNNRDIDEMFFINRRYRQDRPMCARHKSSPLFSSCFSSWLFQYIKKCFIYGTISYWSTNHTLQELDNLKKRLGNRYPEYKN